MSSASQTTDGAWGGKSWQGEGMLRAQVSTAAGNPLQWPHFACQCSASGAACRANKKMDMLMTALPSCRLLAFFSALLLAGCASDPASAPAKEASVSNPKTPPAKEASVSNPKTPPAMQPRKPADMKSRIVRFLPRQVPDKQGWANDVVAALTIQGVTVNDPQRL